MFLDTEIEEECNDYVLELNQYNKDKIQQIKMQNKTDLEQIPEKISYLEKIIKINKEKNGSIDNIINFLITKSCFIYIFGVHNKCNLLLLLINIYSNF